MAARRLPPPAPASSPGLKIKLKTVGAAIPSKANQVVRSAAEEVVGSGENAAAAAVDVATTMSKDVVVAGTGTGTGTLKRKRTTPPASPVPSKKPPRENLPRAAAESPPIIIPLAPNGEPVEVVPGKGESIATDHHVIKQRIGQPHVSVRVVLNAEQAIQSGVDREPSDELKKATPYLENISHGQLQVKSVPVSGGGGGGGGSQQASFLNPRKRVGADPAGFGTPSPSAPPASQVPPSVVVGPTTVMRMPSSEAVSHAIPSHAGWFSWTKIHHLERRGLPEFFTGKLQAKTPEVYKESRNVIIKKCRENPSNLITSADFVQGGGQHHLIGDEKTMSRVLEFLDHWGLINYQAPPKRLPVWKGPALTVEADGLGLLSMVSKTKASLYEFEKPQAPTPKQSSTKSKATGLLLSEVLAEPQGPAVEYHCKSCGAFCNEQRYHSQKQVDFDLCSDCYNDGKFGPNMVSSDFVRMDVTEGVNVNNAGWTDQETLLLLEALELYSDNWHEIAEHVGTKSKSQCILHFIQLPVEDPFLEEMETPGTLLRAPSPPPPSSLSKEPSVEPSMEMRSDGLTPPKVVATTVRDASNGVSAVPSVPPSLIAFADAGNPVMAQVAFIAAMIGPKVAAVAAQAALASLTEKIPGSLDTAQVAVQEIQKVQNREGPINAVRVKQAAASAMAAAAVKAKLLADQEEREVQRLVSVVIEHQLKKLELKLKTFSDLESMLAKECESVERARQKVYAEHARVVATRLGTNTAGSSVPSGTGAVQNMIAARPAAVTFGTGGVVTPITGSTVGAGASVAQSLGQAVSSVGMTAGAQEIARPMAAGGASSAGPQGQIGRTAISGTTPSTLLQGQTARTGMVGGASSTIGVQGQTGRMAMPGTSSPLSHPRPRTTAPQGISRPVLGPSSGGTSQ
ncbi:unnamed protein product [Sphagnum jensenii]|uniref:Uncharacterized protein n=1 Tax=Sphagnum jensenii TaxID=128206 RepID=A0ABP0WPA7_9BRYO